MTFRNRLIATLRLLRPILEEPGVLVVGSEVPNLLEPDAASTLVVSQDVDLGIPVDRLAVIKNHLRQIHGLEPSPEEPSVYVSASAALIEANFLGLDSRIREPSETYVLEDSELPLMVFGPLGLLRPGPVIDVEGLRVPLPRTADLIVEKLLTDRTGEKGVRDLLVVAGLLSTARVGDLADVVSDQALDPSEPNGGDSVTGGLSAESRHAVCSSLTVLSLMDARPRMPDPAPFRHQILQLLSKLEERGE